METNPIAQNFKGMFKTRLPARLGQSDRALAHNSEVTGSNPTVGALEIRYSSRQL